MGRQRGEGLDGIPPEREATEDDDHHNFVDDNDDDYDDGDDHDDHDDHDDYDDYDSHDDAAFLLILISIFLNPQYVRACSFCNQQHEWLPSS